ncbi:hypothetical protein [Corallococcus sp. EGB]|uniref:hypothetical protein n=1 Tax=Corallococcus sp. EGB TaxID=1521117 RepID=UPI001CBB54EF|nr:hypothetical protein [Corallococcus sp. EGB]
MRMRLTRGVEQEDDGQRELMVDVFVHERRGGVAELHPAGAEWRVRWLRGTSDLNRQGGGTAMVRVTAPGLYHARSVASARDAYVEVSEAEDGLEHAISFSAENEGPTPTELRMFGDIFRGVWIADVLRARRRLLRSPPS